jgi:hypothetical protein
MIAIEAGRGGNDVIWLFEQHSDTSEEGSSGRTVNSL